jgi:hypothetical protein
METVKNFWASLDSAGRIAVIIGVVTVLLGAMFFGLDLTWVPKMLGVG